MGIVDIHVNNYCPDDPADNLEILIKKIDQLMPKFEELQQEMASLKNDFASLRTVIDAEQQQVADAINKLNQTEAQLREQIANGASADQLQVILDNVVGIRSDLQVAKDDIASTIADVPAPEPGAATGNGTNSDASNDL